MNKNKLYESIINNIAKLVKKAINEAYQENINILSDDEIISLISEDNIIDEDGILYIDLSNIDSIPEEIINQLSYEIVSNGIIDNHEYIDDETLSFSYFVDVKNNDTLLLRSADYYGITIEGLVNINTEFEEGMKSNDRDVPDDPDKIEIKFDNAIAWLTTDTDENILDENVLNKILSDVNEQLYDDIYDTEYEKAKDNYYDIFDEY